MKFETEYIEKLAQIINDQNLTEISMEDGEQAITIRKEVMVASAPVVSAVSVAPHVETASSQSDVKTADSVQDAKKAGTPITSPMVGTFYMAPSPDSEPFVTVGQSVKSGDVVCIIEAMKMMNEIKAEVAGNIVEICVKNGESVEFGQVLMYVE